MTDFTFNPQSPALLTLKGLSIETRSATQPSRALVRDLNLSLRPGEIAAIVGESGSGKSLATQAILRLLDPRQLQVAGQIEYEGRDILNTSAKELQTLRARGIGVIFQDPMSSLNPLLRIGYQMTEGLRAQGMSKTDSRARALSLMQTVGLRDPESLFVAYPHELSGGMRQRVMIATALMGAPRLLIADEPTTALDVTVQAQVLDLILKIRKETGVAVLLITHDFGVVSQVADHVHVMYAGQIVESAEKVSVLSRPQHPYTAALLASTPRPGSLAQSASRPQLLGIAGTVPSDPAREKGCTFYTRCTQSAPICAFQVPKAKGPRALLCHLPPKELQDG